MQRAEKEGLRALERELRYRMSRLHSLKAGEDVPADLAARLAAERLFARRRSDSVLTDECLLAAGEAEAYYQYLLLTELQEGTVTSFKAGDSPTPQWEMRWSGRGSAGICWPRRRAIC